MTQAAAAGGRPSLALANVSVALGGQPVVRECSLSAHAGEFIVLVGPNGAGKSTLLRAIAGLSPSSGRIEISGADAARMDVRMRARNLAYLPQSGSVHWPMPVRDVVALGRMPFGASLQRLSPPDVDAVEQAMADCDVARLAEKPATELSGGELSRTLLARALASDAPILLLDEPAASLDPAHQSAVMRLLRDVANRGKLVLAVSHDLILAARYATRIILMDAGRIAGEGTPGALFDSGAFERIFGMRFHRLTIDGVDAVAMTPKQA